MRVPPLLVLALALAGEAACFHPELRELACGAGGECPDGTSCVDGVCSASSSPGCADGEVTSISGKVLAPNGTLPLSDVLVYVPDGDPPALTEGASCAPCGDPPPNLTSARTDPEGAFVLRHVPTGEDVRVVIETGKWRRQIVVPAVAACTDTALEPDLTRLPRNRAEGDLPRIALTTGTADTLECLLRKVGIDDGEFGVEGSPQRVHLYTGNGTSQLQTGAQLTSATPMWSDPGKLATYDHVLLSCEGAPNETTKPPQATAAMYEYTAAGGRVLAEHFHSYWLTAGPPQVQGLATFEISENLTSLDGEIDVSTPHGAGLAAWMTAVDASTVPNHVAIQPAKISARNVSPAVDRIVHVPALPGPAVQMFAFTAPPDRPAEERCGRFVFSDAHVGLTSSNRYPFPMECTTGAMRPQEKLLAYELFELGRCVGGAQAR